MKRTEAAVQRRAAEWLALREARGFTAAEHAAFAEWCAADPRHAAIFHEVEATSRTLDRLTAYPHSLDVAADPDLFARPAPRVRPWIAATALATAACAAFVAMWSLPGPAPVLLPAAGHAVAATPRTLRLPDGSAVELNTGAEIAERFTASERRVRLLRGEAHFTVAKNPHRPFIVEAGNVGVRAVGTAFNVRLDPANVEVLVTEGRVEVLPAVPAVSATTPGPASPSDRAPTLLTANQRATVDARPAPATAVSPVETLSPAAIDRVLAWQGPRLVFDALPLADVVDRINRHHAPQGGAVRLLVTDPQLAALRFSGRIRPDNVDSFIDVLEANFGVRAERQTTGRIVLHPIRKPRNH